MKVLLLGLSFMSAAAVADDTRLLAPLPAPAQETLRQEMLDNMVAINEIVGLLATGKTSEAGAVAEARLGLSAMGKNRGKPFEAMPGPNMPPAMHRLGMDGHRAASEFAAAAKAGDRDRAIALLPNLTAACVACHSAYRIR